MPIQDSLTVPTIRIADDEREAGRISAEAAAAVLDAAIAERGSARLVLASAPSQEAMLAELVALGPDWHRIEILHMDEYVGIDPAAPQSFGAWLQDRLPAQATLHRMRSTAPPEQEVQRYSDLVAAGPIDLVCAGIGVNGHLAFNEPSDTDFDDPRSVRPVVLDRPSRQQQVDEGLFADLLEVPRTAITMTVPALLSAGTMVLTVLGAQKAAAVARALLEDVSTSCPASAIRTHPRATVVLDVEAAALYGAAPR